MLSLVAIHFIVSDFNSYLIVGAFRYGPDAMLFVLEVSPDSIIRANSIVQLGAIVITVFIACCGYYGETMINCLLCELASTSLGIDSLEDLISGLS